MGNIASKLSSGHLQKGHLIMGKNGNIAVNPSVIQILCGNITRRVMPPPFLFLDLRTSYKVFFTMLEVNSELV